jgi:hypothetical protein
MNQYLTPALARTDEECAEVAEKAVRDYLNPDNRALELAQQGGDGFGTLQDEGSEYIRGRLVKFADWNYRDRDGNSFNDRKLVAIGMKARYVKFVEGEPPIYVPPKANGYLPDRNSLGDLDRNLWPIKFNERQDPWQNVRYLYLLDAETGEEFTFSTASSGGRFAVHQLDKQIINKRSLVRANVFPLVKLASTDWGRNFPKSRPDFIVVDWITPPAAAAPPPAAVAPLDDYLVEEDPPITDMDVPPLPPISVYEDRGDPI